MISKLFIAAAGTMTVLAGASGVAAQSAIAFDRAALADPAAVEALYADIRAVAERACRKEHDGLSVLGARVRRVAVERCVSETVDAAVRDANAPALHALHDGDDVAPVRLLASRD